MEAKLGIRIAESDVRAVEGLLMLDLHGDQQRAAAFSLGRGCARALHINSVGSFTAKMCEWTRNGAPQPGFRGFTHRGADRKQRDRAGDRGGAIAYSHVAGELGSLLQGDVPGRTYATRLRCSSRWGWACKAR